MTAHREHHPAPADLLAALDRPALDREADTFLSGLLLAGVEPWAWSYVAARLMGAGASYLPEESAGRWLKELARLAREREREARGRLDEFGREKETTHA